jgi:hypothetical protein
VKPLSEAVSQIEPSDKDTRVIDINPGPIAEALVKALRDAGLLVAAGANAIQPDGPAMLKPPPDPEVDEGVDWPFWDKLMSELREPGWAAARIAMRSKRIIGPDHAIFMFASVKGDFGVHMQELVTCDVATGERGHRLLAALSFLPTGFGLAVFFDRSTAMIAADLAADILVGAPPAEETEEIRAAWRVLIERVRETWAFHGIAPSPDVHCHPGWFTGQVDVYGKTDANLSAGKPEKLS